jgi:Tfp pilus assembly protein PilX
MRRVRDEGGFVMVTAIILLTVILGLGLGLLLFSDAQQTASTQEQAKEAAFNVAEAALNAQIGQLARKWPQNVTEMPERCESSTVKEGETSDCPSPTDLKLDPNTSSTTCSGKDVWGSSLSNQWTTYVRRDKEEVSTKNESLIFNSKEEEKEFSYPAQPETGALWVRSVGVVQCHPVTVVSLVTRQRVTLESPKYAIAGNWFKVSNNGEKAMVNRKGRDNEAAAVAMRCEPPRSRAAGTCEEYSVEKEQVSPPIGEEHPTSSSTTFTASQLATLKAEAQAYKTFYSSTLPYHCPSTMAEFEGVALSSDTRAPVYIEGCENLKIKADGTANTESNPGFLIVANGTLEFSGNSTYYGLIYAADLQKSSEAIVTIRGGALVVGGIIVDGAGGIEFGSSGEGKKKNANFEFDSLAFNDLTISAGAAATRNSFRILPSGQ